MIYGAIDEKSYHYHTHLGPIFDALDREQLAYNWLLTDTEVYADALKKYYTKQYSRVLSDGTIVPIPTPEYCFVSGEELTEAVRKCDSQWVWGVFSGFPKGISLDEILQYPLPYADGYGGFWQNPLTIQHPLASIEIVPWDATLVLLLSKKKETVDKFKAAFPLGQDLYQYNAQFQGGK